MALTHHPSNRNFVYMFDLAGLQQTADLLSMDGWGGALLLGLGATLQIAVGGYILGILIGVIGAFGKLYGGPFIKDVLGLYTLLVRSVPELVLILLLYYAGNNLLNILLSYLGYPPVEINGLVAGIYVIGLVQGAYATEVIRSAIQSVPVGQIEAARAYGMSPLKIMRRVTLPGMLVYAIPGLANLWLITTKDTALLAIVGFSELTLMTKQAAGSTKAYFTFYTVAALLYLAVTLGSNCFITKLEKWSGRGLHQETAANV